MLRSAPQPIVESMLDAGLGPKVRKPSAYVVKAIKNKIAEAAAEAAEAEDPAADETVAEEPAAEEDVAEESADHSRADEDHEAAWYEARDERWFVQQNDGYDEHGDHAGWDLHADGWAEDQMDYEW